MRPECIFVQRIDVDRRTDIMYGAEICAAVSGREGLPEKGDTTGSKVAACGRED